MYLYLIITLLCVLCCFAFLVPANGESISSEQPDKAKPLADQFVDAVIAKYQTDAYCVEKNRAIEIIWQRLRMMGNDGREALVPLLKHANPYIRLEAADRLLRYRHDDAVKVLQALRRERTLDQYRYAPDSLLDQWKNRTWKKDLDPGITPLTIKQLTDIVENTGLRKHRDTLISIARPAITVETVAADDHDLPVGTSKLGGLPDLPANLPWPMYEGEPLAFIAQIRLSDIDALDHENRLPHEGMLFFFYSATDLRCGKDIDDKGSAVIIHDTGDPVSLQRRNFPDSLDENGRFYPCLLTFRRTLSLPGEDSTELSRLGRVK